MVSVSVCGTCKPVEAVSVTDAVAVVCVDTEPVLCHAADAVVCDADDVSAGSVRTAVCVGSEYAVQAAVDAVVSSADAAVTVVSCAEDSGSVGIFSVCSRGYTAAAITAVMHAASADTRYGILRGFR